MEKSIIRKKVQEMTSVEDLLDLLNELKQEEYGDKAFPIELKKINYYKNPKYSKRYSQFKIPKKNGDFRTISAPADGLADILHFVNRIFQAIYEPKDCVMGFTENRSVVNNAIVHLNQNYVLNLDLKDFFTSIDQARVWRRIQLEPYNIQAPMANILAGLCSMKYIAEDKSVRYVLPQGSPTSPILSNMVCENLDRRLMGLAKRFGLNYTRYADDITFSSKHNVYRDGSVFMKELARIIADQRFQINEKKTRLQKRGSRQEVTGLIVGGKVNVTSQYVKDIRILLHIWEKYGYTAAQTYFYPRYKEKNTSKKGEPLIENVISGKLMYMKMVKGAKDSTYLSLQDRFDKLLGIPGLRKGDLSNTKDLLYLVSYSVPEFEESLGTTISASQTKVNGKATNFVKVYCNVGSAQIPILISQGLLKKVSSSLKNKSNENGNVSPNESIQEGNKVSYNPIDAIKANLFISLCQGLHRGKMRRFWLLSDQKPRFVVSDAKELTAEKLIDLWEKDGIDMASNKYQGIVSHINKMRKDNSKDKMAQDVVEAILQVWERDGIEIASETHCKLNTLLGGYLSSKNNHSREGVTIIE